MIDTIQATKVREAVLEAMDRLEGRAISEFTAGIVAEMTVSLLTGGCGCSSEPHTCCEEESEWVIRDRAGRAGRAAAGAARPATDYRPGDPLDA
jgi:hypothetical protein